MMGHTNVLPTGKAAAKAAAMLVGGIGADGYMQIVDDVVYTTDGNALKRTSATGRQNFAGVATFDVSAPAGVAVDGAKIHMNLNGWGGFGFPGTVGVFDTANDSYLTLAPADLGADNITQHGMVFDGNYAYTANPFAAVITKRDKLTFAPIATVSVAALNSQVSHLSIHRGSGQLLATSYGGNVGMRINIATMTAVGSLVTPIRQRGTRAMEIGDFLYVTGEANFPYPTGPVNAAVLRVSMLTGAVTAVEVTETKYGATSLGGACLSGRNVLAAYPRADDGLSIAIMNTDTLAVTRATVDIPAASWAGKTAADCALDADGYLWVRASTAACAFTGLQI